MTEIVPEWREASEIRVPSVAAGRAIVVTRYGKEKAVVVDPSDFHQLRALQHDLDELTSVRPPLSRIALEAHALEDAATAPLEDPAAIRAMLGR